MARYGRTLALILFCLPILVTVITAFRVRDLPRSEDSLKYDRKPKCNDCEVKFSHSVKIESDKQHEDSKSSIRIKQQISHQESDNNYLTSDESDEDEHILVNLRVNSGVSKLKTESGNKKFSRVDYSSEHDNNQDSVFPKKTSKLDTKIKIKKIDQDLHISKVKVTDPDILKHNAFDGNKISNDHDKRYLKAKPNLLPTQKDEYKSKLTETKYKSLDKNIDSENDCEKRVLSSKPKMLEIKKDAVKVKTEAVNSKEISDENEVDNKDYVDDKDDDEDDDDDDEDDDDDNDDDDGVLSSLWEAFSMLGLDIDPSLRPVPKVEKQVTSKTEMEKENEFYKNKNEGKYKLNTDSTPKVTQKTNKLVIKTEVLKAKEKSIKLPQNILAQFDDDDEDDNDDDLNRDDSDNNKRNRISKIKITNTQKNVIHKNDKNVPVPTISAMVEENRSSDDDGDDDDSDDNFSYERKIFMKKDKNNIDSKEKKKPEHEKFKTINIVYKNDQHDEYDDDEDDDDKVDDGENGNDEEDTSSLLIDKDESKDVIKGKGKSDKVLPKIKDINVSSNANLSNVHSKLDQKAKVRQNSERMKKDKDNESNKIDKLGTDKPLKDATDKKQNKENIKIIEDQKESETNLKKKDTSKLNTKDKLEKLSHHEEPKKEEKGPVSRAMDKKDDSKEGLNIPEIKKEIKAQIRSSREDKKSEKKSKEKTHVSSETSSSTESYLKHVTDALHRRNLLKSEFEDFYAFFPTFAPNFSRVHNPECRRHGQIVLRQLRGTKLWALNMLDATAKIPSGMLQGNGIQLGDFNQCIQSRARVQLESGSIVKVQGKYCLARLDIKAENPELETPVHLVQAKNLMRSRIDDPGHFVPRFSTLSWGLCVPNVCKPEDVELVIKDAIKHYQKTSGIIIRVKVDEQDCHIEEFDWWKDWIEMSTVLTLSFYAIIVLFVLVATLQDFIGGRTSTCEEEEEKPKNNQEKAVEQQKDSFMSSFSLYRTIDKLVAPGNGDEISCIHGIRGISTIALLIAHKFLPVAGMPYTNRLKITETVSSPLWSWCRAGWMYTDCFLLLSGTLTAHKASGTDDVASRRLFSRYLRLTPALLAVVLFYAYVWDNISSGPMWGTYVTKNSQVCQQRWWWNLLYVQNYFGLEDMCAPQTHQLALDMQLTIVGSVLLWVMQVKRGVYMFILPVIHVLAAYSRYTTVRDHRLTMLAYHGVSVSQLYRTARLSYTSLVHRSTPYLVGISLGLALKNHAEHGKFLLGVGWLSSIALWCLVWWAGADSGSFQYRYQATFAAQYAALAPVAASLAVAWVIYAVHCGGNGFLSRILCCRFLVLISRLSYALYLIQFIVFITNVATVKTSSEFTLMSLVDIQEISVILLSSVILTLTLIIPMQSLHRVFTFSTKSESLRKLSAQQENNREEEQKQVNRRPKETNNIELPQMKIRQHLIAHREILEEIPETEIEYESQRDNDGLGEILEEEEDEEMGEESMENIDMNDELEVIEEEQAGEDDIEGSLLNRRRYISRRSYSNEDEQDLDEWEWTTNGSQNGAQYYRYLR